MAATLVHQIGPLGLAPWRSVNDHMVMSTKSLIFSTPAYAPLTAQVIAVAADLETGVIERRDFPDGERYQRIASVVDHRDCVVLGGTGCDADTLDLFDLGAGLVAQGAQSLSFVIPYFGYGTMDRPVKPGEIVTAKTRALLLSSVKPARAGNQVFLLDAHNEGLPSYFEGATRAFHLYGEPVILPAIRAAGGDDFVLGSVDGGRAKWVGHFADELGVDVALVLKRRLSGVETEVVGISAPVRGRRVVIYDDMIRTGGSLISSGEAYRKEGASSLAVVATHAVLPDGALERLRECGLFDSITVTDSHPRARALEGDFLHVISCAPVLAAPFC